MPPPRITAFAWDDQNADKVTAHGISLEQADSMLDNPYALLPNRTCRRAPFAIIGPDDQSRCLTIPVLQTDDPFIWRPVTAWYCKASEWAKLPKGRRF